MRPSIIPESSLRVIQFANVPGTQLKGEPYLLPEGDQAFTTAYLTLYMMYDDNVAYTYSPTYIFMGRLNMWSLDSVGVDIEKVIDGDAALSNLDPWGYYALPNAPVYPNLHGNKYWENSGLWNLTSNIGRAITAPVYISGWRSTVTIAYGSGTITIPARIVGVIQNLS